MIKELSLYTYDEINPKFNLDVYNTTPLYKWINRDNAIRKDEEIYYLNTISGNYITNNYGYSVGNMYLVQFLSPNSCWRIDTFHIMHGSTDDDHTWRILDIPIEYYDRIKLELFNFLHSPNLYIQNNIEFVGKVPIYNETDTWYCLFDKFGDIIITKYNILKQVTIDY